MLKWSDYEKGAIKNQSTGYYVGTLDRVVDSSQAYIVDKVSSKYANAKSNAMGDIHGIKTVDLKAIRQAIEADERARLYQLYDAGYRDHSLRTGVYSIAEKHLVKEKHQLDKCLGYQIEFLKRRNIQFTDKRAEDFLKIFDRFSRAIVLWDEKLARSKLKYFSRWFMKTFGMKKHMSKIMANLNKEDLKHESGRIAVMQQFFSFKNLNRFNQRTYQAFHKWRLMVKYNYPMHTSRKHKYMSIVSYKSYGHNRKPDVTSIIANFFNEITTVRMLENTKRVDKNRVELSEAYSRLTTGLRAIEKATLRRMESFFVMMEVSNFPFNNANIQKLRSKHLGTDSKLQDNKTPLCLLVPRILAQQVFIFSYKRALISAFKKLQSQLKIRETEIRLREINTRVVSFRAQARQELFIKLFTLVHLRLAAQAFSKWRFQSMIRKAVHSKAQIMRQDKNYSAEREVYKKVKNVIETMANKHVVNMSQIVIKNIKADPEVIELLLNGELGKLMDEILANL